MKLWLIERPEYDYDESDGAVIRAESEAEARDIANDHLSPIGRWSGPEVTCNLLVPEGEPGIVLQSYNAG